MDSQTQTFPDTIAKNGLDMYAYSTDPTYASLPQDQSVLVSQFTAPVSKQVRKRDRPVLATTSSTRCCVSRGSNFDKFILN